MTSPGTSRNERASFCFFSPQYSSSRTLGDNTLERQEENKVKSKHSCGIQGEDLGAARSPLVLQRLREQGRQGRQGDTWTYVSFSSSRHNGEQCCLGSAVSAVCSAI